MSRFTINHLQVFCEVAACLNVTQAANRLHRSQPAISRQLAEFEQNLGIKLFDRCGRGIALTSAAKELYISAQVLLKGINNLSARAQELTEGNTGVLRVGGMTAALEGVLPSIAEAYRQKWPNVVTRFVDVPTRDLLSQVESGELDVALGRDMSNDAVISQRLFPMYLVAMLRRDHPLAERDVLTLQDLEREPLLLTAPSSGSRIALAQICQAEGLSLRDVRMESQAYSILVSMAEAGCGIAVTLSLVPADRPGIKVIPVQHRGQSQGVWLSALWHRRRNLPVYAQAFLKTVEDTTRLNYPGKHYGLPPLPE